MKKTLVIAGMALLLAGCGSSNNSDSSGGSGTGGTGGTGGGTTTPPVSMVDSFFAAVTAMLTPSDTTEPASTDSAVVTSPENTEPEPVAAAT